MKAVIFLLLAGALQAAGIEGTVWYDSKGKIAVVDGPAAAKKDAPEPFVPKWVAREARRDKALHGEFRHRTNRWRPYSTDTFGWYSPFSYSFATGARFCLPRPVPCAGPGLRVIIR